MNSLKLKLKHILLPYIYIAIGTTLVHLLIYYLLVFCLESRVSDEGSEYFLPGIYTIISISIWLRPGIQKLQFKNENTFIIYYIIPWLSILWLCIASNNFVILNINKNIHIDNINEIGANPESIFYTIKNYRLSENYLDYTSRVIKHGGKGEHYTIIELYFVSPIVSDTTKTIDISNYKYWIVHTLSFKKDSRITTEEINKFVASVNKKYRKYFPKIARIIPDHLERVRFPDGINYIEEAIRKQTKNKISDIIILKSYVSKTPEKVIYIRQILVSFFMGLFLLFLLILFPKFK